MRRRVQELSRCACALLILASVLSAQNVVTTHNSSSTLYTSLMVWPALRSNSIPALTDITKGAHCGVSLNGTDASISTRVADQGMRVTHAISSSVQSARGGITTISGTTAMVFRAKTPLRATLRIVIHCNGQARKWTGTADVGGNSKIDLVGKLGRTVQRDFPVVVDTKGLIVETENSGNLISSGQSLSASIEVQLLSPTKIETYGKYCARNGPALVGTGALDGSIELLLIAVTPSSHGVRVIGARKLTARMPGTGCWLNTDVAVALPLMTDTLGLHRTRWPIPVGARFTTQDFLVHTVANQTVLKSTNGLHISRR